MFIFRFFYNFFHNLYVTLYRWYTLFLIRRATKAAAKLMKMCGKDPNYVPPPPFVPPLDDETALSRAWVVDTKNHQTPWLGVFGSYPDYVKNPKEHPIFKARAAWKEKQAKEAAKKAAVAATNPEISLSPTIQETLPEVIDPEKKVE